jgi:hypothetical protein
MGFMVDMNVQLRSRRFKEIFYGEEWEMKRNCILLVGIKFAVL